ncbi:MAG: DNA alkylation repair protein [Bacteroidales bacterium]|nr:DNA alkylation repair protein [Candidatus Sodaliphilus fimicaballi]
MTANEIIDGLIALRDDEQRKVLMRFFKTGPGEYGEGDEFLGIRVPETRLVAKEARDIALSEIPALLTHRFHEVRLCGFLILTYKMERLCRARLMHDAQAVKERDSIVRLYLDYADHANNWDLVDLSAPKVIGPWLLLPSEIGGKEAIMDALAASDVLWRQRIAMVSTWKTTQQGHPEYALRYAKRLVYHKHDLMHKVVGWMLREVGKRCDKALLEEFLEQYAATMPRTALRYAIELMPAHERQYWMTQKN